MQSNFKHTSENCWILDVVILHVHWTGSAKFLFCFTRVFHERNTFGHINETWPANDQFKVRVIGLS